MLSFKKVNYFLYFKIITWSLVFSTLGFLSAPSLLQAKDKTPPAEHSINLNNADTQDLQKLPGIGAKKAQAIVDYRAKHPFKRTQEVIKVKGIGPNLFNKIKNYIIISDTPTTPNNK